MGSAESVNYFIENSREQKVLAVITRNISAHPICVATSQLKTYGYDITESWIAAGGKSKSITMGLQISTTAKDYVTIQEILNTPELKALQTVHESILPSNDLQKALMRTTFDTDEQHRLKAEFHLQAFRAIRETAGENPTPSTLARARKVLLLAKEALGDLQPFSHEEYRKLVMNTVENSLISAKK